MVAVSGVGRKKEKEAIGTNTAVEADGATLIGRVLEREDGHKMSANLNATFYISHAHPYLLHAHQTPQ